MTSPSQSSSHLGFVEKLAYGLGDTASNFVFHTVNLFLFYYYTDVVGIAPAAISTMFLVVRFWDAVNDPIMGVIADRTRTRWGKYRPFLLWVALPFGLVTWLSFSNSAATESGKLVYAYVTYNLLLMVYTAINVPYSALLGVMTPSSPERTVLSSYRFVCAFGGQFIIGFAARPLVRTLGGGDEAAGWAATMALLGASAVAMFLFTFSVTRERVQPPPQQKSDLKREVGLLFANRAWVVLAVSAVFTLANVAVRNGVTVHYFKYYVGDDGSRFFWFMDLTTLFFTTGSIALILGVASTKWFSTRWDKRSLYIGLSVANAVTVGALFLVPKDNLALLFAINLVGTFLAGPTPALVWSMFADVADYGAWKFGHRTTALVFSATQFAQKTGIMLGGFVPGLILGWTGFVANEAQNAASLTGIRVMFTLLPAALALTGALLISFYPLNDKLVAQMERELADRAKA
ncbi:MAG: MFS transporter [Opitutaceae bacterium]|nr:MFS transporter [Opitutaceae bacterium]